MADNNLSKERNEFLQLCIIEQENYDTIAEKLGVSKKVLSEWYDKLKDERIKIASIRTLFKRKKIELPFNDFYNWYISTEKKCFYCGITEHEINVGGK